MTYTTVLEAESSLCMEHGLDAESVGGRVTRCWHRYTDVTLRGGLGSVTDF